MATIAPLPTDDFDVSERTGVEAWRTCVACSVIKVLGWAGFTGWKAGGEYSSNEEDKFYEFSRPYEPSWCTVGNTPQGILKATAAYYKVALQTFTPSDLVSFLHAHPGWGFAISQASYYLAGAFYDLNEFQVAHRTPGGSGHDIAVRVEEDPANPGVGHKLFFADPLRAEHTPALEVLIDSPEVASLATAWRNWDPNSPILGLAFDSLNPPIFAFGQTVNLAPDANIGLVSKDGSKVITPTARAYAILEVSTVQGHSLYNNQTTSAAYRVKESGADWYLLARNVDFVRLPDSLPVAPPVVPPTPPAPTPPPVVPPVVPPTPTPPAPPVLILRAGATAITPPATWIVTNPAGAHIRLVPDTSGTYTTLPLGAAFVAYQVIKGELAGQPATDQWLGNQAGNQWANESNLAPKIAPAPPTPTPPPAPPVGQYYIVVGGDNLNRIAARFGLSLYALERLNPQITNPALIYPGQRVRVK